MTSQQPYLATLTFHVPRGHDFDVGIECHVAHDSSKHYHNKQGDKGNALDPHILLGGNEHVRSFLHSPLARNVVPTYLAAGRRSGGRR